MREELKNIIIAVVVFLALSSCSSPNVEPSGVQASPSASSSESQSVFEQRELATLFEGWQPISSVHIEPYPDVFNDYTQREMALMSNKLSLYPKALLESKVLFAATPQESFDRIEQHLPSSFLDTWKEGNRSLTPDRFGQFTSDWAIVVNRLNDDVNLKKTSFFTYSWHAEDFKYDNGDSGVKLTIFFRTFFHFIDANGDEFFAPVARWYSINTTSPENSTRDNDWGWALDFRSNTGEDTCTFFSKAIFTGTPLNTSDSSQEDIEELRKFASIKASEYVSIEQYSELVSDPSSQLEFDEEKAKCQS